MGTPSQGFTGPATPSSQYYVYYPTANGLTAYTLTGIVQMLVQGQATGVDFFRTPFFFDVPIPDLPPGKGLQLVHWAPFVTLNSISNDGVAENAGWAVDDFIVLRPEEVSRSVSMQANLAVRDIDGYILRCGYDIHLLGKISDLPPAPR
ncbi:MAG: hypothetical protein WCC22_03940 [Terriglobales bacterium]